MMAGSVNKVILIGNLGKDPEVRTTQGGKMVNFTLATSETWNDKASGERKERIEWHRIVIFNENLGSVAERFLRKGRKVYIEGAVETRKWTDQSGAEKYTTEIVLRNFRSELVLLDSRQDEAGGESGEGGGYAPRERAPARAASGAASGAAGSDRPAARGPSWDTPKRSNDLDDDIPF